MSTVDLKTVRHAHFTGIKGVGMCAAALCLQDLGIHVTGSDVAEDFVTHDVLEQRELTVQEGFDPSHIGDDCQLLVYTGAHGGVENIEVVSARERGIPALSQAEVVGLLMGSKQGISVCGVGGKTSVSAMLANVFDYAGKKPSYLIGVGKVLNLQTPGRMGEGDYFIAEADEYVVSPGVDNTPRFMSQLPRVIVCTNVAHDHPDVYPDIDATKQAFASFFASLPSGGLLVINGDSEQAMAIPRPDGITIETFGEHPDHAAWWVKESTTSDGKQLVVFAHGDTEYKLTLRVPGMLNARNALAAFIVAKHMGIEDDDIVQALQLFRGSMRRFEKKGERSGILYYDDYAHHPMQIQATLKGAKAWLPSHPLTVVFQPHTYSRTKVLLEGFSQAFSDADTVVITDIYASRRESEDPSISGAILAEEIAKHHTNVTYVPYQDLVAYLAEHLTAGDALFTLGAGDIYTIHERLMV